MALPAQPSGHTDEERGKPWPIAPSPAAVRPSELGLRRAAGRDWTGAILGHGPNRGDKVLGYLFLLPSAILLSILVLYPFSQVIFLGFYEKDTLLPDKTWVGLDNYRAFFEYPDLANAFRNTVYWTVGSVVLEMLVGHGDGARPAPEPEVPDDRARRRPVPLPVADDRGRAGLEVHAEQPGRDHQLDDSASWASPRRRSRSWLGPRRRCSA